MKVLITGISGRVGANLAHQLMKRGDTIRGLIFPGDPKTEKVQKLDVEVYEADMHDAEGVYRACDGVDAIVHLAAQMKQGTSTVQRMVEINSFGTLNVLEGAVRSSTKIQSILLAGTDQAYHPFVSDRTTKAPAGIGEKVRKACVERGLFTRAIGDILAFAPPIVINGDEVDQMVQIVGEAVAAVAA